MGDCCWNVVMAVHIPVLVFREVLSAEDVKTCTTNEDPSLVGAEKD